MLLVLVSEPMAGWREADAGLGDRVFDGEMVQWWLAYLRVLSNLQVMLSYTHSLFLRPLA